MFTEYGTLYGVFMLLVLLGGGIDVLNTLRVVIFKRDILEDYATAAIKWLKIVGCLAFAAYMAFIIYNVMRGALNPPMSQLMFSLHLTAGIIMTGDFFLSAFLKIKYGSKKKQ
jgi:hypothetical protein